MFKFKDLMIEGSGLVVISFGRFNPPTIGHEKVIEKVKSMSGSAPFRIYPSHSVGPKDPLPHTKKIAYMRKMFPKYKSNIIADKQAKTVINIAEKLYKEGFTDLLMVAGSDRVKEFETLLQKYNGKADKKGKVLYDFNSVKVVNAGQRDPDAEGVEGMSASKMRKAASDSDFDLFKNGIPNTLNKNDKKKLYLDVRKHMGIREEREMGELTDFESMRDAYLTGRVWKIGDVVESNGHSGEIINRGTNYISFVDADGKVHKSWLHDIVGVGSMTAPTGQIFALKSEALMDEGKKETYPARQLIDTKKEVLVVKKNSVIVIDKINQDYYLKKGWSLAEKTELDERNYKLEYANYQGTPEQIARRSSRNKARRAMGDKAVKGMDVGHKDNDPMNNDPKNLKNEDPSKNRREPRLREKPELDEVWWDDISTKISQISHPTAWSKVAKQYVKGMEDPEHRKHPEKWADEVAMETSTITGRDLVKYINRLVSKGKLPKELRAWNEEKEQQTFADLVKQINSTDKKGK